MRIALASYEYPPETGGGGIGTYLQTVATFLHSKGHSVVVFCGTRRSSSFWEGAFVYRISAANWVQFDAVLPDFFSAEHLKEPFDVLEATDFQAAGLSVKKRFADLPVVVRLHTPLYLVDTLLFQPPSFTTKFRMVVGALRRGQRLPRFTPPAPSQYQREFELMRLADRVSSPSLSIANVLKASGFAVDGKTGLVPLPFDTAPFSAIGSRSDVRAAPRIVFVGRMELRKGVIDLAAAIPIVLRALPHAQFTFIGQAAESPVEGLDMKAYLQQKLSSYKESVSFPGPFPRHELISRYEDGDIFVFPSHYESFGLSCCEAMAAGKAVVASKNGGMAELIEDGISGILVSPKSPIELAKAILRFSLDNAFRIKAGTAAKKRIQALLLPDAVLEQQLGCYRQAIAHVNEVSI